MLRSIREEINDEDDDDNGDNGNDHDDGYREFCISRKESTNSKRVLIQAIKPNESDLSSKLSCL